MGQIALGFRSLLIRLTIFFVMALLLAWALGGTLWPRPVTATAMSIESGGVVWNWDVRITSYSEPALTWILSMGDAGDSHGGWLGVEGFVEGSDGLYTAAEDPKQGWQILQLQADGGFKVVAAVASRAEANRDLLRRR